jgi:hypothetical protein
MPSWMAFPSVTNSANPAENNLLVNKRARSLAPLEEFLDEAF